MHQPNHIDAQSKGIIEKTTVQKATLLEIWEIFSQHEGFKTMPCQKKEKAWG